MQMTYSPDLKAHLSWNDQKRVEHILHTQEYFRSEKNNARLAAIDYLNAMAETFQIPQPQLRNLHQKTSFLDPREQDIEYRQYEVKKFFASATYCYYQTVHNVPIWRAGATVTVKENPYRVVHACNQGHETVKAELPARDLVERIRAALVKINSGVKSTRTSAADRKAGADTTGETFANTFPAMKSGGTKGALSVQALSWMDDARITRGLFYFYRYDSKQRIPDHAFTYKERLPKNAADMEASHGEPTLPLGAVPDRIKDGQHYLVVEVIFHLGASDRLNWKALVEVETGAILWLRAMTSGVNALVFPYDPKTATGNLGNTPDSTNAVLNPLRVDVVLLDLNPPVAGTQSLSGTNVTLADDDAPTVAPPTKPSGTDFDYAARTNEFAAVNAYYHTNNVFNVIEDLGFVLSNYFDTTAFPVHVDHRASIFDAGGIEVNAFCNGDGPGGSTGDGIGMVGYCLSDDTGVADTTTNPLGRSVDKWVHWHELGGHGILWDHVSSPNFGFAHSAGDALAAFQNDPESQLRALPERFQYAPFRVWPAGSERFFNRTVASGWGWGGANDTGGYMSEQIVATTLFRMYRSLGGDANEVAKRWQASRTSTYLVLNAVGKLSPGANANTPLALYNKLYDADADDWTSEGWAGGAYNKVIRWSFEKQNLFGGAPPTVDLYIDDGRGGEYQYQPVHWANPSVWNRTNADGLPGQQPGVAGVESYAYVKVKNRGTTNATGTVKVYHCNPGAGLTWPVDFQQATPLAGLPTGNVLANNGNEVIVGPFAWTPNPNVYGHDCLLAIVETGADPSNVNNLEPGQTIQEWRLVPHDNNIGQRNVQLVPGESGEALLASMDGVVFFAGNNFNKTAAMEIKVDMPRLLQAKGWRLTFADLPENRFRLKAGEKRLITLKLARGQDFTAEEVRKAGDTTFNVYLYGNGMLMGGMSYKVDPDLKQRPRQPGGRTGAICNDRAKDLLHSLNLCTDQKIKAVRVKNVAVDIELDDRGE